MILHLLSVTGVSSYIIESTRFFDFTLIAAMTIVKVAVLAVPVVHPVVVAGCIAGTADIVAVVENTSVADTVAGIEAVAVPLSL